jgi:hypothetical protein
MSRSLLALLCPLLLSACSAEVAVETPPQSQAIPITSIGDPVYAEVAVDLPPETRSLDVIVKDINATLTVVNPSQAFTLDTSVRLSFTGTATPDKPVLYSEQNKPAYYATAEELMPRRSFAPGSRTPLTLSSPGLVKVIGQERIWIIISNTVTRATIGGVLPLEIQLQDAILHATVSKPFHGLEGALGVGGL